MSVGIITRRGGAKQPMLAIGGVETEITQDGVDYRVHTFTDTGISELFVVTGGEVEFVLVGSGGSGGSDRGGGGGGGEFLQGTEVVADLQTYNVTVGAGVAGVFGANFDSRNGRNGNPTSFLGNTASGGDGGNTCSGGGNGIGSGGGGGNNFNDQRAQRGGSNGGNGEPGSCGGGTGQGAPTGTDINGTFTLFSGGGGGGRFNGSLNQGGDGGGGNGGGGAGAPNTGGGGGGGNAASSSGASGSGIAIIRYRI